MMGEMGAYISAALIVWALASLLVPFFVIGIFARLGRILRQLEMANKMLAYERRR